MIKYFIKIFATIFIPFLLLFIVSAYIHYTNTLISIESLYKTTLKTYWIIISELDIDKKSIEENKVLFRKVRLNSNIRVTLLNNDGVIILDSDISKENIGILDDHSSRQEIQNLSQFSIRRSKAADNYSIYYASRLNSDTILRVASDGDTFKQIYIETKNNIIRIVSIFLVLSVILSIYITYRLIKPAIQLSSVAKGIKNRESNFVMPSIEDKIMDEAATVIYDMKQKLARDNYMLEVEEKTLLSIIDHIDESIILVDKDYNIVKYNSMAEELFTSVGNKANLFINNQDYEEVAFFKDILSMKKNIERIRLKDCIYEVYIKDIKENILIVLRDITLLADYEDFKSKLTANIAHEIKTPIAVIMAAGETLYSDKNLPDELKNKFLEKIYKSSIKLNSVVNQTLKLYKSETATADINEKSDINIIISDILLQNTDKKIHYINNTYRTFNINSFHIETILINLINNAIKYSTGMNIYVSFYENDKSLIIETADEGPAIAKSEYKRIFERFYTVSQSRNDAGFGLGLSIVKHTILLYHGSWEIFENEYKGNTFKIILYEID